MGLFSNRSQMASKYRYGKNKKVAQEAITKIVADDTDTCDRLSGRSHEWKHMSIKTVQNYLQSC